jgi:hypothetical protein
VARGIIAAFKALAISMKEDVVQTTSSSSNGVVSFECTKALPLPPSRKLHNSVRVVAGPNYDSTIKSLIWVEFPRSEQSSLSS